jgi:hypothetical protein
MVLDRLFDGEPLVRTRRLPGCVNLAGLEFAPRHPGVKGLTGCGPDSLGPALAVLPPVQVKGAPFELTCSPSMTASLALGLPSYFTTRDELPFSVNPAILFKVHLMSTAAFAEWAVVFVLRSWIAFDRIG